MPFTYCDDEVSADAAFIAWGEGVEELFSSCADALLGIMVGSPESVEGPERYSLEFYADSLEFLLHDLLQEILYQKDAHVRLMRPRDLTIEYVGGGRWRLRAVLRGASLDRYEGGWLCDVKAVTFHRFTLREREGQWEATVVVDL